MCPRIVADIVHEMSPSKKAIFFVHEMSYDLSTKCHVICPRIVGKNVHEMSSNPDFQHDQMAAGFPIVLHHIFTSAFLYNM